LFNYDNDDNNNNNNNNTRGFTLWWDKYSTI